MMILIPEEDLFLIRANDFYCDEDFLFLDLEIKVCYRPYKSEYSAAYRINSARSSKGLINFEPMGEFVEMCFDPSYFLNMIGFYACNIFGVKEDPFAIVHNLFLDIRPIEINTQNGLESFLETAIWIVEVNPLDFERIGRSYV